MLNSRVSLLLLIAVSGCAVQSASRPVVTSSATQATGVSVVASTHDKAAIPLEKLQPAVRLSTSRPVAHRPPVEAVRLFAQARIAELDGERLRASRLLEQAIALDPDGFALHKELGDLYASAGDSRSAAEWEKAATLEPDHLQLQVDLGRHAMDEGDFAQGIEHLRLALLTSDYRADDPASGEADFLLARALQHEGYDHAALQMYERLVSRLNNPRLAVRVNPQVASLLAHPDALALNIAALYEKNKAYGPAINMLRTVAVHTPNAFEINARLVQDTAASGDRKQAIHDAAALVIRFHASPKSLALLREVAGQESVSVLQLLHQKAPDDRDIVYALSDTLFAHARIDEQRSLLEEASRKWPDDLRILRRQVGLLRDQNDMRGAARLVVLALARQPNHALELDSLWDTLSQPAPWGTLHVADVEASNVPQSAEAARLVLLARLAETNHRDALEREALRRAMALHPVFAPAWREAMALIWADSARKDEEKAGASKELAQSLSRLGQPALAAELMGQAFLAQTQPQLAAAAFADAAKAGDRSPELYLNFAAALHGIGDDTGAESILWRVISDHPLVSDGYTELYALYEKRDEHDRAQKLLALWENADPESTIAPRLQARAAFASRQFTQAEQTLVDLLDRHDSDPQVLGAVEQFYDETGRLGELAPQLEKRLKLEPWNSTLAIALSEIDEKLHQHDQAVAVVDALRARSGSDVDLLYTISGLYSRLGEKAKSEAALADILKLDPTFAGANNDLGYTWAEQGRNLGEAETLVRKALQAEPDNLSFLDSMGWVLYKRGKFEEALAKLTRAALLADPVVLDHLGDTLYRLGDHSKAAAQWQQAVQRITDLHEDDRDDLKQLHEHLLQKQHQLDAGQPVGVAPVSEKQQ